MALAACLLGCSPKFDWRVVQSNQGAYSAMYPGKPTSATRDIEVAGKRLPMTMQAARVDDTLFAVGVIALGHDDAELRAQALAVMQSGLLANLQDAAAAAPTVRTVALTSATQPPVALQGVELEASGTTSQDHTPRRLTARLVAVGAHAYQAVVLESGNDARKPKPQEQIEQFFSGFHPF
jgi:DNA-binding NarL/FixJ family response regulator